MSHLASPTNRNSIFGWVKNLKRGAFLLNDSVNDISDNDLVSAESKSPPRSSFSTSHTLHPPSSPSHNHHLLPTHLSSQPIPFPSADSQSPSSDFLRPLLQHKLRSTNNVNRVRSNSNSTPSQTYNNSDLRQHRDLFLQSNPLVDENSKYFGVPLLDAISQALAKISILGATAPPKSSARDVLHYGRIPIVVAKCGVYLKKNGLTVEGIFRVGGASKRIKELQLIFNSPPEFGKKLSWDGYTVHDAASVLRRYLNALPEPLVPLDLYHVFREPLKTRPRLIKYMKYKASHPLKTTSPSEPREPATPAYLLDSPKDDPPLQPHSATEPQQPQQPQESRPTATRSPSDTSDQLAKARRKARNYKKLSKDIYEAIDEYKELLDLIPQLSKQLLFYILDLLAMVQGNSNENLMLSRNLAAIFQPCILSHPDHDMDPDEYVVSQMVVEFLIQYAYKLLPNNEQPAPKELGPSRADSFKTARAPDGATDSSSRTSNSQPPDTPSNTATLHSSRPRASGRQHSQSLLSPNPDDVDLIGFHTLTKPERGVTLSDTDHDFASASSDDEYAYDNDARASGTPNLLYVVNGNRDSVSSAEPGSPSSPPIVVSHANE